MKFSEVRAQVRRLIETSCISGQRMNPSGRDGDRDAEYYRLDWERGVAEASLAVSFSYQPRELRGKKTFEHEVRIGWSSTQRSSVSARAAVVLYTQVVDLACTIDALLNNVTEILPEG